MKGYGASADTDTPQCSVLLLLILSSQSLGRITILQQHGGRSGGHYLDINVVASVQSDKAKVGVCQGGNMSYCECSDMIHGVLSLEIHDSPG